MSTTSKRICNRTDHPQYSAISYTWGDTRDTRYVRIDGKMLAVAENCWIALRQVRLASHVRWIWIDAISINQKDRDEKNHQVQEMARVYENATCVLVSLGMDGDDAELLFEWVDALCDLSERSNTRTYNRGDIWNGYFPQEWQLEWFDKSVWYNEKNLYRSLPWEDENHHHYLALLKRMVKHLIKLDHNNVITSLTQV